MRKKVVKTLVFVFSLVYLSFQTASPALAATVSDSYTDSSKINTGTSSDYEVSGGQLKIETTPNTSWWKMNESSGSTVADSSGNGNDGTATGTTIVTGKYGNARSFNGTSSDNVSIPYSIFQSSVFTIAFWFKANSTTCCGHMIWAGEAAGNGWGTHQEIHLTIGKFTPTDNVITFYKGDANNTTLNGNGMDISTPFSDTTNWHHLAVVVNGTSATLYLDGSSVGTDTSNTLSYNLYDTAYMGRPGAAQRFFNGSIDDVRIYNYTRTQAQIQNDMNNTIPTSSTIQSTNLLSGESNVVTGINSFVYNLSSKPAGTGATVQFSQDASSWYNSSGTSGGTDTLTTGVNNTIDLSGLAWDDSNFYYKIAFSGDGTNTPTLDDVTVNYSTASACSSPLGGDYSISGSCAFRSQILSRAVDFTTNGNKGTPTGTTIVNGKYGSARKFDGASDYVSTGNVLDFDSTSTYTLEAWVKTSTSTGGSVIAKMANSSPYTGYDMNISASGNAVSHLINTWSTDAIKETSQTTVNDGSWHHIAVTYDGSKSSSGLKIYIDSQEDQTTVDNDNLVGSTTSNTNLQIGSRSGGYNFDGIIDDVRIYNYVRSADQVKEDMRNAPITGTDPVGRWKFDDGYIEGVDNGNMTIQTGTTLTINSGQTIAWNPGKSITIQDGASIVINQSGQLKQSYLWVEDADNDGLYLNNSVVHHSTQPANHIRRYLAVGPIFGSGSDGSITVSSNTNLNTWNHTGRSCLDGGDAVSYSTSSLTANTATLSTTPSSGCLTIDDYVLLINLQGTASANTNVGNYEVLRIQSISTNTITFTTNKKKYYGDTTNSDTGVGTNQKVMLQRIPQYQNVTVNSGINLYPNDWDGTKSGVLAFVANGTVSVSGTIHANGKGYRGGVGAGFTNTGGQNGESFDGYNGRGGTYTGNAGTCGGGRGSGNKAVSPACNRGGGGGSGARNINGDNAQGGGGGGGYGGGGGGGGGGGNGGGYPGGGGGSGGGTGVRGGGGGGGGSHLAGCPCSGGAGGNAGSSGSTGAGTSLPGLGGSVALSDASTGEGAGSSPYNDQGTGGGGGGGMYGVTDLSKIYHGSGGAASGSEKGAAGSGAGKSGGDAGGIIVIYADTINITGSVSSSGNVGVARDREAGAGGNGSGGSILFKGVNVTLGSNLASAPSSGANSAGTGIPGGRGGGGGVGRIAVGASSVSGTTNPTYTSITAP